jgi:hypothetical protein
MLTTAWRYREKAIPSKSPFFKGGRGIFILWGEQFLVHEGLP